MGLVVPQVELEAEPAARRRLLRDGAKRGLQSGLLEHVRVQLEHARLGPDSLLALVLFAVGIAGLLVLSP